MKKRGVALWFWLGPVCLFQTIGPVEQLTPCLPSFLFGCMLHNLHQLRVSLAVAAEGREQARGTQPGRRGLRLGRGWLSLPESCFPLWLCHRETRAGQRKEGGIQKLPDQEQSEPFLAVVPLLKAEPAVNRGERDVRPRQTVITVPRRPGHVFFFSSCMSH